MTAKEYLQQAFLIDRRIKAKERQLDSLKAHAVYTTPQFEEVVVSTSAYAKSALEESAVKIMELESYIASQIDELTKMRRNIADVIQAINNPEYETILEMRYLSFMSWDEIAARMDYCKRYMFKVHGRALEMIRVPDV